MGAVEFEESADTIEEAAAIFCNRWDEIVKANLNDYGPEEGDGLYLYDLSLGSVVSKWDYVEQSFFNCFSLCAMLENEA
jgi:hypothetical protein